MELQTNDRRLPFRDAPDFLRVYGSIVTLMPTSLDVTCLFGQAVTYDIPNAHLEHNVSVTMSWHAVKAFAQLLNTTIARYEQEQTS